MYASVAIAIGKSDDEVRSALTKANGSKEAVDKFLRGEGAPCLIVAE